jgi:hypothetical protein
MQATIDAALIQEAIRVALRLSPPITEAFILEARKNKLRLISVGELSKCTILLPCEVTGNALFAVPTEALKDATAGRTDVTLTYDQTMLKVKKGTYSTSLTTLDAIQPDADEDVKGDQWTVTADQLGWLKDAVSNVALKPTQSLTTFMPLSLRLGPKSAFVSCYDQNHMTFTSSKEITGKMDLTLPLDILRSILDTFTAVECELTVSKSAVRVKNPIIDVVLSLPDVEDEILATEDLMEKAKEARTSEAKTIEIPKKEILAFLVNARAVATRERSEIEVIIEPGLSTFVVKTTNGTSRVKLKAATKEATTIKIDYEYFDEVVRKSADSVSFKIVDNFAVFKTPTCYSLIALNQ